MPEKDRIENGKRVISLDTLIEELSQEEVELAAKLKIDSEKARFEHLIGGPVEEEPTYIPKIPSK